MIKPHSTELNSAPIKVKRALLSVSDKTGIIELAKTLATLGVEILSTGGTARTLKDAGIKVTDVSEITGFPECLDGRVKTLHPKVHGGILARTSYEADVNELEKLGVSAIELVVVNLYPFQETVAKSNISLAEALENIDIGGPTMVRASAKNFPHVGILTSPQQYGEFVSEISSNDGFISFETRKKLGIEAFKHTSAYESAIAFYLSGSNNEDLSDQFQVRGIKSQDMRYGENPHQKAAAYGNQEEYIDCFHGKQLSYNNMLDVDAALRLMQEFQDDDPTVAIFKHTVPCGVASSSSLAEAYKRAFATDPVSPFGGIIATNKTADLQFAKAVDEIFSEIIIAPDFDIDAEELLTQKKNRRLIRVKKWPAAVRNEIKISSIFGGFLAQEQDNSSLPVSAAEIVTKRQPTKEELANLAFAWKVVKHVKSNAIVFARDCQTLGIGGGQTSRVDSSEIAVSRAHKYNLTLEGSAIASDAFFPFSDGIEAAAKAGATCVIQPGGSIRDEEVIAKANEFNMAMLFTKMRHFRH